MLKKILLPFICLLSVVLFACKGSDMESRWLPAPVTVDGHDDEWRSHYRYFEDKDVDFGVFNDGERLYLSFSLGDAQVQKRILASGMTVWFDRKGGTGEGSGISLPGLRHTERRGVRGDRGPGAGEPPGTEVPVEQMVQRIMASGSGLLVHTEEADEPVSVSPRDSKGIGMALGYRKGYLVCELSVPLKNAPGGLFAVGADTGDVVGIGFETMPVARKEGGRGAPGKRRPSGGGGGRPGGGRGGRGVPGGSGGGRQPDPFEIWIAVRLAGASPDVISGKE